MTEASSYRVKFVDIRVPSNRGRGKPEPKKEVRVCDAPSCSQEATCRVSQHPSRPQLHYWYCQSHAAEHNRRWNYFDGLSDAAAAAFQADIANGHRKTWKFGRGPMGGARAADAYDPSTWRGAEFFDFARRAADDARKDAEEKKVNAKFKRAYSELGVEGEPSVEAVRERYAEMVKRLHPDMNGGDRSSEEKLARVIQAYKALKAAGRA